MKEKLKCNPLLLPSSHSPPESILVAGSPGDGKSNLLAILIRLAAYMKLNPMIISCFEENALFKIYQRIPFSHQYVKDVSSSNYKKAHVPKFFNLACNDFSDMLIQMLVQVKLEYSTGIIFIDDLSSVKADNFFGSDIRLNFKSLVRILKETLFKQNISLVISRNTNRSVAAKDISQYDYTSVFGGTPVSSLFDKVLYCTLPEQDRFSIFPDLCIKFLQNDSSSLININCI